MTHIPECSPDFVIAASEEELGPNESIVSLSNLDDFICGGEGVHSELIDSQTQNRCLAKFAPSVPSGNIREWIRHLQTLGFTDTGIVVGVPDLRTIILSLSLSSTTSLGWIVTRCNLRNSFSSALPIIFCHSEEASPPNLEITVGDVRPMYPGERFNEGSLPEIIDIVCRKGCSFAPGNSIVIALLGASIASQPRLRRCRGHDSEGRFRGIVMQQLLIAIRSSFHDLMAPTLSELDSQSQISANGSGPFSFLPSMSISPSGATFR